MQRLNRTVFAHQSGFSLIELMVVVAILGIITSIAVPSYQSYVQTGNATEATANLSTCRVQAEQFYQDNFSYVGFACQLSDTKFFDYVVENQTATTYTLKAEGKASQGMQAFSFSVNQDNAKTSVFDGVVGASCWLTSNNGVC